MKKILKFKNYFISIFISVLLMMLIKLIFFDNFYILLSLFFAFYFCILYLLKEKLKFSRKEIILPIIISLLFSLAFYPIYSFPKQNFSIEFEKVSNSEEFYGKRDVVQSVKICDIKSGPYSINMKKTFGTQCIYLTEKNNKVDFTVIPNLPLTVTYEGNSQSANAKIIVNDKSFITHINSKVTRVMYEEYKQIDMYYSNFKAISKFIIVCLSLFVINLIFIKLIRDNKKFMYACSIFYILFLSKILNLTNNYCLFLLALFLFISFILVKFSTSSFIKKYFSRVNMILFVIITLIITFMCVGYEAFMSTKSTFSFNYYSILYFLVIFCYVFFVVFGLLILFDNIKLKAKKSNKIFKKSTIVFLLSFVVLSLSWLFFASIFYPGLMSVDSMYSWKQASLITPFDDFHPIFFSFFLYVFAMIFKNPYSVIIFQNIASALLIAFIIRELYIKGINIKFLILIILMFIFIPNISIMQSTMWKDIPFTISLLLVTFLLYKLSLNEKNENRNIVFLILFSISLVLLLQFRYNGIIAVIFIFLYLIITSIKKKNLYLAIVVVFTILLNMIVGITINKAFDAKSLNVSGVKYTSIIKNFAATLYYNKDLNDEAEKKLDELFNKKDFILNYESTNIDSLYNINGKTIDYWLPQINNYSMGNIISLYLKNIIDNPDVFIRDKLNGMNIMFNLNPKYYEPIFAYYIGNPGVSQEDYEIIKNQIGDFNVLDSDIVFSVKSYLDNSMYSEFQNIIWRASFWVALLLVAFLYLFISNSKKSLIVFLPLLGYTLSWCIALNHQSFRYIYYINYMAIFVILLALILKERRW